MINVKTRNRIFWGGVFFSMGFIYPCYAKEPLSNNCISLEKDSICISEFIDSYEDSAFLLVINNIKYYKVSYYNNASIKKNKTRSFEISSNFSDRGNVNIVTTYNIVNNKPHIKKIYSSTRINESPYGAIEICNAYVNQNLTQDIDYYIDKYIFDLPDSDKSKICKKIKLKEK